MIRNISNLHLEILDNKRKKLFTKLISLSKGFVLGGGTALSLQVGHRISFDFDFFGTLPLNKKLLESLTKSFSIESVVVDSTDELTFFTDGVKVTFIYYPFRPIFEIRKLDDGLSIYQVKEIAIQKAYTIGRRGEYRDYFDLYTILSGGHINFDEIINKAKKC